MLVIAREVLTEAQKAAWKAAVAEAAALDAETGDGNGWMFHGTDHLSSTHILNDGFRNHFDPSEPPERIFGYFGCVATAASFAEKRMDADSPPALLAVRTSDLVTAGISIDPNYADSEDDLPTDWQSHVRAGGTVRIRGGAQLPSLRRFGISEVPLHPDAIQRRRDRLFNRMRYYGRCGPHASEAPHLAEIGESVPCPTP